MDSVTIATPEECAEFEKKYRAAAETLFDPLDSVENDLKDISRRFSRTTNRNA